MPTREQINEYNRNWYHKHKDLKKHREKQRLWRIKHPGRDSISYIRRWKEKEYIHTALVRLARIKGCSVCQTHKSGVLFHWHHFLGEKGFELSQARMYSRERLRKELTLVVPLCPSCHSKVHNINRDTGKGYKMCYQKENESPEICMERMIKTNKRKYKIRFDRLIIPRRKRALICGIPTLIYPLPSKMVVVERKDDFIVRVVYLQSRKTHSPLDSFKKFKHRFCRIPIEKALNSDSWLIKADENATIINGRDMFVSQYRTYGKI